MFKNLTIYLETNVTSYHLDHIVLFYFTVHELICTTISETDDMTIDALDACMEYDNVIHVSY